jgi:hypothetical protein
VAVSGLGARILILAILAITSTAGRTDRLGATQRDHFPQLIIITYGTVYIPEHLITGVTQIAAESSSPTYVKYDF